MSPHALWGCWEHQEDLRGEEKVSDTRNVEI